MGTGVLALGLERPGREANEAPRNAEVKNTWSFTLTSPYVCLHGTVLRCALRIVVFLHQISHISVVKSIAHPLDTVSYNSLQNWNRLTLKCGYTQTAVK
jgi:hypothetical protein